MFDRLRYKISQFMQGRNGADDINRVLILVILVTAVLSMIFKLPWLYIATWVLFGIYLFRYFSRNIEKRYAECKWCANFLKLWKMRFTDGKEHSYFMCRRCSKVIRVPKHRGKLEVRCPECSTIRIINTGAKR